jgi:hypothetical protein
MPLARFAKQKNQQAVDTKQSAHPNKHSILEVCSRCVETWGNDSTRGTPVYSEMEDNKRVATGLDPEVRLLIYFGLMF